MNMVLKVEELIISTTNGDIPMDGCAASIGDHLDSLRSWSDSSQNDRALWHFIDDCFGGSGTVGLAYVSVLCSSSGYNTGVSYISDGLWLTVAHEVGHNIGGSHPFGNDPS